MAQEIATFQGTSSYVEKLNTRVTRSNVFSKIQKRYIIKGLCAFTVLSVTTPKPLDNDTIVIIWGSHLCLAHTSVCAPIASVQVVHPCHALNSSDTTISCSDTTISSQPVIFLLRSARS